MRRLTVDDLRRRTLQRQFPAIEGTGPESVLKLFSRLGPIQSQVPRAPFLTVSSRLPGVRYETIRDLFEQYRLLKTTNIRGTVHTSTREHFGFLDAVARRSRAAQLRNYLKLERVTPEQIGAQAEDFASADWRPRADIVTHLRNWLSERESPARAAAVGDTLSESLLWGHSGLVRRPRDDRWEKRTDIYHQRARSVVPELEQHDFNEALTALVRIHLGSYGPATRDDLAFFFGTSLGSVDKALQTLGQELVRLSGPDRDDYLDLAQPPTGGEADPGLRLLPEFDGLLVGYAGKNRLRFLEDYQLPKIWAKVNGLFSPIVLYGGRIVASWKTLTRGSRTDMEVRMLDPHPPLNEEQFTEAIVATEAALDLKIGDLRVIAAS
jgi:winged helix DNA-binding protein